MSKMSTVAENVETLAGAKVSTKAQLRPGATVLPVLVVAHVSLLILKSVGSVTVTPFASITRLAFPVLVTVTVCCELLVPTTWFPKLMLVGDTLATGADVDAPTLNSAVYVPQAHPLVAVRLLTAAYSPVSHTSPVALGSTAAEE